MNVEYPLSEPTTCEQPGCVQCGRWAVTTATSGVRSTVVYCDEHLYTPAKAGQAKPDDFIAIQRVRILTSASAPV